MCARDDAGVVDHGIHPADGIDLPGEVADLRDIRQVADRGDSTLIHELLHGRQPGSGADMHDNVVAFAEQRPGRGMAQAVG